MAPDVRTTTIRWEEDWVERIRELAREDEYVSQWIRSMLYPVLNGYVRVERDDEGQVVRIVGRDAEGRRAELVIDPSKPINRRRPVSPPPVMGRPRTR